VTRDGGISETFKREFRRRFGATPSEVRNFPPNSWG